jgi:hypothetical protein
LETKHPEAHSNEGRAFQGPCRFGEINIGHKPKAYPGAAAKAPATLGISDGG